MAHSAATLLLLFFYLSISSCSTHVITFKGIDAENPVVDITPSSFPVPTSTNHGSKDVLLCGRVRVGGGVSRLKLRSYANAYRVTLAPSVLIPETLHSKIQICFHRNASLGLCQCEKDKWSSVRKGLWSSVMSPYEERYIDVKFVGEVSGSVTVTVEEEFQRWRLICLALGLVLLLLAPSVSSWVPFYYSSSMAIGVLLVIIILLFQGMKLLPTGRKNVFYLSIYGSVLGAGSFLLHHLSLLVNSILVNFGLSEEMHNPVYVVVLVLIIIAEAALGYWIVRKFVISEDGSVDVGIAQFVKWAMRIIAATFIFQSSLDTPLALVAFIPCLAICFLATSPRWRDSKYSSCVSPRLRSGGWGTAKPISAELFSRSKDTGAQGTLWNSPRSSPGLLSPSSSGGTRNQQDYYSTFHRTPNRKRFSIKEWREFTQDSTHQAVAELASSPEFTDWMIKHADRIQLLPDDISDETSRMPNSSDENTVESRNWLGFF
ncbi:uncharacterized protein LOC132293147 [Cornus florida]|uniref:uncharacterized protein LOC132293147 n=1 Tax=Cornus florida TaxID=4283 RepID=UPI00289CC997|nr:uncharacterized protein LOC132293147 [Cornus florida]